MAKEPRGKWKRMADLKAALNAEAKGRAVGLHGEEASEERWGRREK